MTSTRTRIPLPYQGHVGARYGSGWGVEALAAAVEAVRYEGLDLSHLRVW